MRMSVSPARPGDARDTFTVAHYETYVAARSALRALDLGAPSRPLAWQYRGVVSLVDRLHQAEGPCPVTALTRARPELIATARTAIACLTEFGKPADAAAVAAAALDEAVAAESRARDAR